MLDNCSHEELENSAEDYMLDLRCADPENLECFPISLSNVGFVPLYGGYQTHKVLALFELMLAGTIEEACSHATGDS